MISSLVKLLQEIGYVFLHTHERFYHHRFFVDNIFVKNIVAMNCTCFRSDLLDAWHQKHSTPSIERSFYREILDFSSLRLIRLLLSNTFLQVRIQSEYGDPIITRSGTPVTHLIHAVHRICYERISFKTVTTNSTSSYADDVDMIFSSTTNKLR